MKKTAHTHSSKRTIGANLRWTRKLYYNRAKKTSFLVVVDTIPHCIVWKIVPPQCLLDMSIYIYIYTYMNLQAFAPALVLNFESIVFITTSKSMPARCACIHTKKWIDFFPWMSELGMEKKKWLCSLRFNRSLLSSTLLQYGLHACSHAIVVIVPTAPAAIVVALWLFGFVL